MDNNRPLILISNDDGIAAPGIHRLVECVADLGRVFVVAPDGPRSGQSSALTVDKPLRITRHEDYRGAEMYSTNGTPVDCVKLALHTVLPERPALMLSGINHGSNAGNSVIYSGTMGAAFEAAMAGIPAIGFSLLHHSIKADFTRCLPYVKQISAKILEHGLPIGVALNVNFPAKVEIEGLKVVRAAESYWTEEYADYIDPQGRPFYLLTGRQINRDPNDDTTDLYWLERNYTTLVPCKSDQTDTSLISSLSSLLS
ncbi:MAG: 5'/3'-nucleotidase SurE [Muribaculaceae bacterium]|nr:5'/3'-nucleotidase SurE [Muribaculaceae bacterium]